MLKKFALTVTGIAMLSIPMLASARDRDDYPYGRDGGGHRENQERRERSREHERQEWREHERRERRGYNNGYYNNGYYNSPYYSPSYGNGYYDAYGNWHSYGW